MPKISQDESPKKKSPEVSADGAGGAAAANIDDLKRELKDLVQRDKERDQEVKELIKRLQGYEENIGDIKLLADAVKKNAERIAALESLADEEDEEDE